MIAAATPMRTSVSANVTSRCTTTRSHAAIRPMPPARTGPVTAAIVGTAASIKPLERPNDRRRVGRPAARPLLEIGAGAERRRVWVSTIDRTAPSAIAGLGAVERNVQVGDELAGQRVAVGRRVERDRGDAAGDVEMDEFVTVPMFARSPSLRGGSVKPDRGQPLRRFTLPRRSRRGTPRPRRGGGCGASAAAR